MDARRPPGRGLLDQAPRRGRAAADPHRGAERDARRDGPHGGHLAQATAEWLRYVREERAAKASTLDDYRNMVRVLDRALGHMPLEQVTLDVLERWRAAFIAERSPSNRTVHKYLIALNSIFKRAMRAFGLPNNPASLIERPRIRRTKEISVLSAPEVHALAQAAASEQDAVLYLTAAFTGLRMGELLALRWRDIDFQRQAIHVRARFAKDVESTPKSGSARTVPMVEDVARELGELADREKFIWAERPRLLRPSRWAPGLQQGPQALPRSADEGRPADDALPRAPPHVWHARDPARLDPPGPDLARPRRHQDDADLPALPQPRGRRRTSLGDIRCRGGRRVATLHGRAGAVSSLVGRGRNDGVAGCRARPPAIPASMRGQVPKVGARWVAAVSPITSSRQ